MTHSTENILVTKYYTEVPPYASESQKELIRKLVRFEKQTSAIDENITKYSALKRAGIQFSVLAGAAEVVDVAISHGFNAGSALIASFLLFGVYKTVQAQKAIEGQTIEKIALANAMPSQSAGVNQTKMIVWGSKYDYGIQKMLKNH